MITVETTLIPQNVALPNAKVKLYDKDGNALGNIRLSNMSMPSDIGTKPLYSVGLISDPHVYDVDEGESSYKPSYDTNAPYDLERAIKYFKDNKMAFVCSCGDLTSYGTTYSLVKYKEIVDANRGDMPVYSIAGNHEYWGEPYGGGKPYPNIPTEIKAYTEIDLFDVVEYGNDVFIFAGASAIEGEFTTITVKLGEETKSINKYDWLVEQFNKYKDKRIFLFMHCFLKGVGVGRAEPSIYCGDATGIINTVDMVGSYTAKFIQLLQANPNVIYFHGHSHTLLEMQEYMEGLDPKRNANYDFECGVHSIHIPSTTMPRDISNGTRVEKGAKSEGYIMDVYEKHIVLKGIDFVSGENIPIATYCLETK